VGWHWVRGGVLALALVLVLPSSAAAVPRNTPPGLSELDQYSETVLGAGGEHTIKPPGNGSESILSPSTEEALQDLGPAGQATVRLANETAPGLKGGKVTGDATGGSATGAVVDALGGEGDGGLGIFLPLILLAVAAAGIGYALLRRRAGHAG
jgi:hypothetical protein